MTGLLAVTSEQVTNYGALAALIAALAAALNSIGVIGPNRRKIVEDTNSTATSRATAALESALTRVEADNTRLREDVDQLEAKTTECLERLRIVTVERDSLAARIERMNAAFAAAGIEPPA